MKTLTKLFVAAAVLFANFACTTDATNDLAANLSEGGKTTITLSLEESRTQLGAEANGIYPVTWSENDIISVNGVESQSITIAEGGKVATFTFAGVVNYPYSIAYPAAAEGKVVFAGKQSHTESTFANGAAAMYGYVEAEDGMKLNHLTGVLKIAVKGDKTLSLMLRFRQSIALLSQALLLLISHRVRLLLPQSLQPLSTTRLVRACNSRLHRSICILQYLRASTMSCISLCTIPRVV